jgi:UDP-galactopyranose mutase
MEYFVFENDDVWTSTDDNLIDLAKREIAELGLVKPEEIEDGAVVRMPKAYPCTTADGRSR